MIKKYVCDYCRGFGIVTTWHVIEDPIPPVDPDAATGELFEVEEQCPRCTKLGAPPWVEMAINGPPSPREGVIDVEYIIIEDK
jgi:hypothetical protein